jgi:hypothetical protein
MIELPQEEQIIKSVEEVLQTSPFRVQTRLQSPRLIKTTNYGLRRDATIELEWDGFTQRFAVEYKSSGTPKQIDASLNQIARSEASDREFAPMIVTPYLQPRVIERMVQEQVSAIDMSGNYIIIVPGRWLVIKTGASNKYPSSAPIKNVYRGTSSLIPRALMLRGQIESSATMWSILQEFGPVSKSTISKVFTALEEDLIVLRQKTIRVIQPAILLDNLARNYKPPTVLRRLTGKVTLTQAAIRQISANSTEQNIRYAVDSSAKYAILPSSAEMLRIYTSDIDKLIKNVDIEPTARFMNTEILQVREPFVFLDRPMRGGLDYTSPLQIYLELESGGKRERQAAQQIREQLLRFEYQ